MRRLGIVLAGLLVLTGCAAAPAPDEPPEASPAPAGDPAVRTDWSRLGERPEPLPLAGRRWDETTPDCLIPREDYGLLVPYAGQRLMSDWPAYTGCLYGLMTRDGTAVTAPVYGNIYCPSYYTGQESRRHPLLVLAAGAPGADADAWNPARYAVAAADGSWCTELQYRALASSREGLLLLEEDGSLSLMRPSGELAGRFTPEELGLSPEEAGSLASDLIWGEGIGGTWCGDYVSLFWTDPSATSVQLFQISARRQTVMTWTEWENCQNTAQTDDPWEIRQETGETLLSRAGRTYLIPFSGESGHVEVWGDLVLFPNEGAAYTLSGREILPPGVNGRLELLRDGLSSPEDSALLRTSVYDEETGAAVCRYYRPDGTRLDFLDGWENGAWYRQIHLAGGLVEALDLNTASYYSLETGECVFRTYLGYED